jgi:hypothetical protein
MTARILVLHDGCLHIPFPFWRNLSLSATTLRTNRSVITLLQMLFHSAISPAKMCGCVGLMQASSKRPSHVVGQLMPDACHADDSASSVPLRRRKYAAMVMGLRRVDSILPPIACGIHARQQGTQPQRVMDERR